MITRKQYINNEATHEQYYNQFITDYEKNEVLRFIGLDTLKNSTDEYMNDIPLGIWNIKVSSTSAKLLRDAGDYLTQAGNVCIMKATARQLLADNK